MTNDQKHLSAEKLFDSIGLIDDRFVAEADTPYRRKSSRTTIKAFLIAAVSMTLIVTVLLSVFAVGMLVGTLTHNGTDGDGMEGTAPENDMNSAVTQTLELRLDDMRDETAHLSVSKSDIDLFDGSCRIVWKFSDEKEYRARKISEGELQKITHMLSYDKGTRIDSESTAGSELEGVWLCTGDGRVISPYLDQTRGNVGYGEIFEYEPEYEPSEEFSEYLCNVISQP